MNRLLTTMATIATLAMLAAGPGIAGPTHPNEIGLYTTSDGWGESNLNCDIDEIVNVYLVLTRPTNEATGEPCSAITAFECQLNIDTGGWPPLSRLSETYLAPVGNDGTSSHPDYGWLEYILGPFEPVAVTGESILLITFEFATRTESPVTITMSPTWTPTIPGQMAFGAGDGSLHVMHSVSGDIDAPVFSFNGDVVGVIEASFGQIKALYR